MKQHQRVRTKICGITRVEDGLAAAQAGADAIGLVFYAKSGRHVSVEQAQRIVAALPPFVSVVGLFVNESAAVVKQVLQRVSLDVLQFHGDEPADYCGQFNRRYIKAIRMREGIDLHALSQAYQTAGALLVDAYHPEQVGGTGLVFDWERLPNNLDKPLILAGGLNPQNIKQAIQVANPWGVDVSGGVEAKDNHGQQQQGIKSSAVIDAFMRGVAGE